MSVLGDWMDGRWVGGAARRGFSIRCLWISTRGEGRHAAGARVGGVGGRAGGQQAETEEAAATSGGLSKCQKGQL